MTALVKMFAKTELAYQHVLLMAAHVVRMLSVMAYSIVQSVNAHLVSLAIHKLPVPTLPVKVTVNVQTIEPASIRNVLIHAHRVRIVWNQLSACHITTKLTVRVLLDSVVILPLDVWKVCYSIFGTLNSDEILREHSLMSSVFSIGRRGCQSDSECPSRMACINEKCVNPCEEAGPCGKGGVCNVLDTTPVRTMICECPPGYEGNAVIECKPGKMF